MNLTNPFSTPTLPGVAGPAKPGQPVIYDPSTGLYVNQSTGGVSTDPAGQHPVQNPSLATQAARNISVSNALMSKLAGYGQQYGQAFAGQTGLVSDLDKTIAGTAPSVAGGQLEQGLGQIRSAENSMAAGATGANAALARTNGALGFADAASKENQAAAMQRAQEVQAAQAEKGVVLGQQAGEAVNIYGQSLTGANNAANIAGQNEQAREEGNAKAQENQNQLEFNLLNGVGQDLTKGIGGGGGSSGGASGASDGSGMSSAEEEAALGLSDRREKKEVKEWSDGDMKTFLDKLSGYGFEYKNPGMAGAGPGARVGVMAQDVKQGGPIGKGMVVGDKPMKLDLPNAVGAALAAVGWLKKQIDEQKRKAA